MSELRPDLALIAEHVAPGARVLDIGCGDGALMAALRDTKGVDARGMEIDPAKVVPAPLLSIKEGAIRAGGWNYDSGGICHRHDKMFAFGKTCIFRQGRF